LASAPVLGEDEGESALAFSADENLPRAAHRHADPIFAYLLLLALGIGLAPLDPMLRYLALWTLMGGLGLVAYFFGGFERMGEARILDLLWGVIFGLALSLPFFIVFGSALGTASRRMFDVESVPLRVMDSWVFMALVFVMPASESLFFRGGMQGVRSLFLTAFLATLWSCTVFFPHMELAGREVIAVILLFLFAFLNFIYSYVRFRNGLAAAWLCQVTSSFWLWFLPRLLF
jgi:hypothetical protein